MSKTNYFDQVRAYQKDHPSLTWKECCNDVSLFIQSAKKNEQKAKLQTKEEKIEQADNQNIVACPACGYGIPEPGNAWICLACGHQN